MANKNSNNTNRTYTLAELTALAEIPANHTREYFHAIWETGKKYRSRDEQTLLWERLKAQGVKGFAGRKWRADHPDDTPSEMPAYITEAQEKRKAEKAAAPAKQEKPKTTKAKAPAKTTAQPKAETKPATKAKAPTYTETLLAVVACMERMDKRLESIDNRLSRVEKKLGK